MSTLFITRGLPASGKTTWAREQQANDPALWRVNRDDLRAMVASNGWNYDATTSEDMLTAIQHAAIAILLDDNFDVVVDDTNLRPADVERLEALALDANADIVIKDFTDVPLATCIERDVLRRHPVGEKVIRSMHDRYLAGANETP